MDPGRYYKSLKLMTLVVLFCFFGISGCFANQQNNDDDIVSQIFVGTIRLNKTRNNNSLHSYVNIKDRVQNEILSQITAVLNQSIFKNTFYVSQAIRFRPDVCQFEITITGGELDPMLPYNLTQIFKEGLCRIYDEEDDDDDLKKWIIKATDVWFIDSNDGLNSGLPQPDHRIQELKTTCTTLSFPPCMSLDYMTSLNLEGFPFLRSPLKSMGLGSFRSHLDLLTRNCSHHALDFICSLSFPRCNEEGFVFPCKQFCDEILSSCNFAHSCEEFVDDDDPSRCYMPKSIRETSFPKVLPEYCGNGKFLCDDLECIESLNRCDGVVQCKDGSDEAGCRVVPLNPLRCDFEHSSWCGLVPTGETVNMWRLVRAGSVATSRNHGNVEVLSDHTLDSTGGWVALSDASGTNPSDVTRMMMRPYTTMFPYCLSFYYTMPSKGSSHLNIYLAYAKSAFKFGEPIRAWHKNGWSPHWRQGQVDIQPGRVKVIFEAVRGRSYRGDVILDDVNIVVGKCQLLNCSTTEFRCNSTNKCVGLERTCDKVNDCDDNSDEADCDCSTDEFQCTTGGCIEGWRRCDGDINCYDESDEEQCACPMGQVKCSGKCIMREWVCDGQMDCEEGEDESNCGSGCSEDEFECSTHQCIPLVGRCDGRMNCQDRSDEIGCLRMSESLVVEVLHGNEWMPLCAENITRRNCDQLCRHLGMNKMVSVGVLNHHDNTYLHLVKLHRNMAATFRTSPTCYHHHILTLTCEPQVCSNNPTLFSDPRSNEVEGHQADVMRWPWMVGLYHGRLRKCGATLIDPRHLLTAAHCFDVASDLRIFYVSRGSENRSIERVYVHPDYSKTSYWFNDLAVIRLDEPMTSFMSACLLDLEFDGPPDHGSICYSGRWTYDRLTESFQLNRTKLSIWRSKACKESHQFISENNFCAGYSSGVGGLCQGDSGNPILCLISPEQWRMVGMFSFYFDDCRVPMKPSGFINITTYVPWIRSVTRCPFWCKVEGRCLWGSSLLCDGVEDCSDGSDEEDDLCERNVTCNFEDPRLCGYEHILHHFSGKWFGARMLQEPVSTNWGPLFDHTLGNASGHFLLGGSKPSIILSPTFATTRESCLQFYYVFRGRADVKFRVYVHNASSIDRRSINFQSNRGNQSFASTRNTFRWDPVKLPIPSGRHFVEFRIERNVNNRYHGDNSNNLNHDASDYGYTHENYVGLDDVSLILEECNKEVCGAHKLKCEVRDTYSCEDRHRRCNIVYDCDGPSDEKNCTDSHYFCSMENLRDCNLFQPGMEMDHLDWSFLPVAMTHLLESGGPLYDHTYKTTAGHVAYFSTIGFNPWVKAFLEIPIFLSESSGTSGCFSFHLSMISTSSLTVFLSVRKSFTHRAASFENLHQQDWVEVEIPINNQIEVVVLQAEILGRPHRGPGYIAIDDVSIYRGPCRRQVIPAMSCHHKKRQGSHDNDFMFACKDGSGCIGDDFVCDGRRNCRDGSDEESCDHFKCFGGGGALPQICDGISNCFFGEDEEDCDVCLPGNEFQCSSGNRTCIPLSRRCDNIEDCEDKSDEHHCVIQNHEGILQGFKSSSLYPFCADRWNDRWNEEVCGRINGGSAFQVISIFKLLHSSLFLAPLSPSSEAFRLHDFELTRECTLGRVVHLVCMPRECGLPTLPPPQDILSGVISRLGQWPYIVSVLKHSTHLCTGVLIHESWVLTAARCFGVQSSNHRSRSPYLMPRAHHVRAGSIINDGMFPSAQTIRVKRIHIDVYFDQIYFYPDIALVELELPLATNDFVKPACLPTSPEIPWQDCYLVGWNILNMTTGHLGHVKMNSSSSGRCPHRDFFLPGQMCFGGLPEVIDPCHVETGGPLMCLSPSGRWNVMALVSGGRSPKGSCATDPETWTVFTRVQSFMDWIPLVMTSSH